MAPKVKVLKTGNDPRGNLPALTQPQVLEVWERASITYGELMQYFNITSDQVWEVRRLIWTYMHKATTYRPTHTHGNVTAGTPALLWQVPCKPKNDGYYEDAYRAMLAQHSVLAYHPDMNTVIHFEFIGRWIKKEQRATQKNAKLQDPNDMDIKHEIFGIDPPQTLDKQAKSVPASAKKARKFGACWLKITLEPAADGGAVVTGKISCADFCGGNMQAAPSHAMLAQLKPKIQAIISLAQFYIGTYGEEAEEDQADTETVWRTIRNQRNLRERLSAMFSEDKSGGSLEIRVRRGETPNSDSASDE
ncbi:hypothetical protein LTR36_006586 [Oleoguttula mirabilis]|uniref:Uncharacterized protein n=1 Tax=Oleoguttula mirabilis TaxID=1507867 RepID=A0AAV9JC36_9PEZI|nr:hypothetical protein LTR36_006586 [Oleoguttula mirabilis]